MRRGMCQDRYTLSLPVLAIFLPFFKLFKVRLQGKEQENDPDTEPFGYSANGEVVVLDAGGACRTQQDIANDVNKWRIQNGWTQAKLAEELDVSEKTAGRICRGEKVLNPSEIGILSSLMHKPPGFFITGSHYSVPEEELYVCSEQSQIAAGGRAENNGKRRPKDREGEDDAEADPEWEEFCMHICSIKDKKERQFWLQVHYGRESLR